MGDGLSYLARDSWSILEMEPFELDALAAMLERATPQTKAEEWMRQRVLDAVCRRDQVANQT